jgi:IS605 OrfB family transposase
VIAWAEVSKDGNLISYGQISMHELLEKKRAEQRKDYLHKLAHEITNLAKEKSKAIAIEKLKKVSKGQRGDGRAKLRKRLHNWVYKNLLEKIKTTARRKGIEVIEVNPAYTSIIGALKYCPNYLIDKDTAGAYVIGRRALGFKEDIPENYLKLLNDKDYMLYSIAKLEERKQELKARLKEETNIYKRKAVKQELSTLNKDIELLYKHLQSLESEPSTQEPVNRGKEQVRGVLYGTQKAWQVLKVALVFPILERSFNRDFSPLRALLISGDWSRRTNKARPLSEWVVAQSYVS